MNGRKNASLFSNQHQEGFRGRWPVVVIKAAQMGEEAWHSWLEGDGDPEFSFPGVVNLGAVAGDRRFVLPGDGDNEMQVRKEAPPVDASLWMMEAYGWIFWD